MRIRLVIILWIALSSVAIGAHAGSPNQSCSEGEPTRLVLVEPPVVSGLVGPIPSCTAFDSGTVFSFQNADIEVHQIRSLGDEGACWSQTLAAGGSFALALVFDGEHLTRTTPGPASECDDAAIGPLSTKERAVVPYECRLHPSFSGRLHIRTA